jgi:hypothetical protein
MYGQDWQETEDEDGVLPEEVVDLFTKLGFEVREFPSVELEKKPVPKNTGDKQVGGDHYQMPIQPIEFIVANDIPYREANVIKYVCRHYKKAGADDIKKAIHYLEMILEEYDKVAKLEELLP